MIKAQYDLKLAPLERLKAYGIRKAIRIALNRTTAPVKEAAVAEATRIRRYGFLAKAQRIKTIVYPSGHYTAVVGPASKFERTKGKYTRGKKKGQARKFKPGKVAHLVDKGTRRSKARHWITNAYKRSAPRWLRDIAREVAKELQAEAARQSAT